MTRTRRSSLVVLVLAFMSALVVLALGASSAPSKAKRGVDATIVRKTLTITGNDRANTVRLRLRRRARNTLEVDTGGSSRAEFRFDRRRFKRIVVRGRGGGDRVTIDERRGVFTTAERTTVFGDAGNDRFTGGRGRETFNGGAGQDSANGGRGADVLRLGGGDDNVRSDASGGDDRADGAAGNDSLIVVGTAGPDSIALAANAGRLRVANGGSVDAVGFESVDVRPLAGTDGTTVGDLSGTGVVRTTLGLAGSLGGAVGDSQADAVVVEGTQGPDNLGVSGGGAAFAVGGLPAALGATGADPGIDRLTVNGLGGPDTISAAQLGASAVLLAADGGQGADSVSGGPAGDALSGGDGDDQFRSNPGEGSDRVAGDGGIDRLAFQGSGGDESLSASAADAGHLRLARSTDGASVDVDGLETVDLNALGGADSVAVGDLGGTDATRVDVDLAGAPGGSPDGQIDELSFTGGAGNDAFALAGGSGDLTVAGAVANTTRGADPGDKLTVDGGAGNDTVDASGLPPGLVALTLRGGEGADNLMATSGPDSLPGEPGDDTIALGGGDDVFTSDAGDGSDTVDGQDGSDRVVVNGTDGADDLSAAADAGRLRVSRAGVPAVDGDGIETLAVDPRAGGDVATIGNLTGTDVSSADIDLGADGQADTATVHGTTGNDNLVPTKSAQAAAVTGLPYAVNVVNGDGAADGLSVDALDGSDQINATDTPAEGLALTLRGGGQADVLRGGVGNETLIGGPGDDQALGNGGDDRMIWNPGDETDLNEGGDGNDTSEVNGGDDAELFTVTANGARVRFDRLNPAPFSLDIGTTENLVSNMNGGNDQFSNTGNLAALIKITGDGGAGQDTLLGSNGIDLLLGGGDNDFVDGQQGNDTAFLGAGDDVFQWDPGDGSDTVEGQEGSDTLLFNGSNGAELFEASANGGRLRFTRNLGNIVMDTDGIEVVDLNALGSTDGVTVNDLSGTDVTEFRIDLAGTLNGNTGDAAADNVIVNGTNGADVIGLSGSAAGVNVTGLATLVSIIVAEAANDRLTVNGLGGDDLINAPGVAAGAIALTLSGDDDDDVLNGGAGDDTLLGGNGDDLLDGNAGIDTLDGGTGTNTLIQD